MNNSLQTVLREASAQYGEVMTSALRNMQREDVGWALIGGGDTETSDSVPLEVVKAHSVRSRRLVSLNPLVKRGVMVRNAYMWADMPDVSALSKAIVERNHDTVFSLKARCRDESALCTDGMVVYLVNKGRRVASPVPLKRVRGIARADDATDESDIYAFLIDPVPVSSDISTAKADPKWYVVDGKQFSRVVDSRAYDTDTSSRVVYLSVNQQAGEQWGKPDLMGAVYWAQAYKEFLEAAHNMAKALARIAFKAQSMNSRQQNGVIQQMAGSTGSGGTVSLGMGQDLTAVSKSGAGLDFSSATPLAAMVSASLDVPLSVLLTDGSAGGRQGAETALEDPTFKAFDLRRNLHIDLLVRLAKALGDSKPDIKIGTLNNDLVQRRLQSIVLGLTNGLLWREEGRSLTLSVLRPANARPADDLPPEPSASSTAPTDAAAVQDSAQKGATGTGPLSDGTNASRNADETVA